MATVLQNVYRRVYEGVNYRLRTVAQGRWADHCRPTSIIFLLTELCNARCVHCDIWKNRGKEDSSSVEQWKQVLSDLRNWLGPVAIAFSGGEALLRPFTPQLVRHAHKEGLLLEVLTHGYWDNQTKIEELALAHPWRATVSLDGLDDLHTQIRGREQFFEKTFRTIETFKRMREMHNLSYTIRLKTVIMAQNLDGVCEVVRFAKQDGMEIFLQPIEQNYNTEEDPRWFEQTPNWPQDTQKATRVVQQVMQLKREGYPVANSFAQLQAMIPYFQDPDSLRVTTQSHSAHERRGLCAALTTLQFQANGDVTVCYGMDPVGNIKHTPIREIWENRPHFWDEGCCLERRCSKSEKEALVMPVLS